MICRIALFPISLSERLFVQLCSGVDKIYSQLHDIVRRAGHRRSLPTFSSRHSGTHSLIDAFLVNELCIMSRVRTIYNRQKVLSSVRKWRRR